MQYDLAWPCLTHACETCARAFGVMLLHARLPLLPIQRARAHLPHRPVHRVVCVSMCALLARALKRSKQAWRVCSIA